MKASSLKTKVPVRRLVQSTFDQFKNGSPLAIVRVFRGKGSRFLQPIAEHFVAEYPGLACAELDIALIVYPDWAERHIGPMRLSLSWPIGYHLFANGEHIAYHSGERADEGEQLWSELGVQLVPALLFNSNAGIKVIEDKKQREQATAVVIAFERVLAERASKSSSSPEARDPWAILGVDPSASDQELVEAHRGLVSQYHPDIVARAGPEIRELANTKLTQINCAWDEIKQLRGL